MRRNEDLDRQIRDYKQKFATDMEVSVVCVRLDFGLNQSISQLIVSFHLIRENYVE